MVVSIDDVPPETIRHWMQYLDALECVTARCVCRKWRSLGNGCGQITLIDSPEDRTLALWKGIQRFGSHHPAMKLSGISFPPPRTTTTATTTTAGRRDNESTAAATSPLDVVATGKRSAAIRLERNHHIVTQKHHRSDDRKNQQREDPSYRFWKFLNLTTSKLLVMYNQSGYHRFRPTEPYWLLYNLLQEVDLSGLDYLEKLCVDDCARLVVLRLPPSTKHLQADNCRNLRRVLIPRGIKNIQNLSLAGCSMLQLLDHNNNNNKNNNNNGCCLIQNDNAMKTITTITLSDCPVPVVKSVLSKLTMIQNIFLDHTASDDMIYALLQNNNNNNNNDRSSEPSSSAPTPRTTSLRVVDLTASKNITEPSIEALVAAAPHLEELDINMCPSLSDAFCERIYCQLTKKQLSNHRRKEARPLPTTTPVVSEKKRKKVG